MEGSAAHVVAEQALKGIRQPDEWTDRLVQLDQGGMEGIFVDEEMTDSISAYVADVLSSNAPGVEILVEQRLSLSALDPSDPIFAENRGTGDAVILDHFNQRIGIKDLKYGKGVMVAGDSPQLKNYAVLAVLAHPETVWKEVELTIIQPRAVQESERRKSFIFDPADLMMDFLGKLLEAMHIALGDDPPLKTGKHCRWCPAKDAGVCPAIQTEALTIARDAHTVLPVMSALSNMGPIPERIHIATLDAIVPPNVDPGTILLPLAAAMGPDDIATVLDRRHLYDIWIQSVEERACSMIEAGMKVPGWGMYSRSGNRRWKAEPAETETALREIGVKTIEMYTSPKMLSPAQIEKKLKPAARALLEPLVERPMGAPTLMRATEAREATRQVIGGGMGPIETTTSMGAIE
jgi:hypothetical protein